jgi:hypothetical protein
MAEIELSILSRQCLERRITDQKMVKAGNRSMTKKKVTLLLCLSNGDLPMKMLV